MKPLLFFLLLSLTAQSQVWETVDFKYIPVETDANNPGDPACEHEWYYDQARPTICANGERFRLITVQLTDTTRYTYDRTRWAICSVCLRHERFAEAEFQTLNRKKTSYAILKNKLK